MTATPNAHQGLGRLERLAVRSIWINEALNFTPWLAQPDNVALLGEAIGMELEVQHHEHPVGPFRADIVCVETGSVRKVLIENQLERTDHSHLGQLLTYAAGTDAVSIVWIAERFTEEHRATLDWLNRVTDDHVNFFGIEIELWKIGNSLPAPKFNVVAKPNEWTDAVDPAGLSETQQVYLEYWTAFKEYAVEHKSPVRLQKPLPQTWTIVALGRTHVYLSVAVTRQKAVGLVQLVLAGPERLARFKMLCEDRAAVEASLGTGLEWRELPDKKESHVRRSIAGLDLDNRQDWSRQHEVLLKTLNQFHAYFAARAKTLDPTADEGAMLMMAGDGGTPV